jgi:cytochrome c oxidase cbb3-type subunit 3
MSSAWSWYVIIGTVLSMLACSWLIVWTNRQRQSTEDLQESESHVWDENIRELNNPLPMWWLWLFILTLVFSGIYLVVYPGLGNVEGSFGWSQAAQYEAEVAAAEERYGPIFARYGSMEVPALAKDPAALSIGQSLYANYCSQCHGSAALGARGFPNLQDSDWLWGGGPAQIEQTILAGRTGVMPALGGALGTDQDIDILVDYVRSMADGQDASSPAHTKYMTLCFACHGPTGQGNLIFGAPNLADDIWVYGSSTNAVRQSIVEGRIGEMPPHEKLLGTDRARILAAYIYSLSNNPSE